MDRKYIFEDSLHSDVGFTVNPLLRPYPQLNTIFDALNLSAYVVSSGTG